MKKILLLSMPFGALERPALGLSLLKTRLQEVGIGCDVRYLSFTFADLIGAEDYLWISSALPYIAFAGDWSFSEALYGARAEADAGYIEKVLRKTWRIDDESIARIKRIRALTSPFLNYCLESIPWEEYAVAGFTSTFEQNLASLALAKRIKAAHPAVILVFGGANWEAEMGQELHRRFEFVDYVCPGEADESFPALARLLLGQTRARARNLPAGILYRRNGKSISTGKSFPVRHMDSLPVPNFSDYFEQWSESSASLVVTPTVLMETSRGCWWGDKSHCTFCGLNGANMAFRSKSARRVLDEMRYLADRWHTRRIEVVDNILDMKYFTDLLPALAQQGQELEIFYEVKANLTRQQVALLRAAGINRIQPGIESLSDHVLKLMRKGTSGLRNVQLLKWCKEYGITVDWNMLYGFPGETRDDYSAMLVMLPAISFLNPPTACGPIRLDRFSPYFESPDDFGFVNVRPIQPYSYLYPFGCESLMKIAYYFDFDYRPEVDPTGYAAEVIAYAERWRHWPEQGVLYSVERPDGTRLLRDTRAAATYREIVLSGLEDAAYEYCDEFRPFPSVVRHLTERFPEIAISAQGVQGFLDSLVANRLMVTDGRNYLSLALQKRAMPAVDAWQTGS
jgi:ribosomal peptide maturation radical SAM protein 1